MARNNKRKAPTSSSSSTFDPTNNNNNTDDTTMWGGGSGSSRKKSARKSSSLGSSSSASSSSNLNESAIEQLFLDIADEDDTSIATMEGISKLCDSLGIDPMEDIRILVLMWKMDANDKPAQISKDEWRRGCHKLQVDSIAKFQSLLPSLDTGFLDQSDFKQFYKFCFQFNRQGTHRTLDKDLVVALLPMVLKERIAKDRLETFLTFLEKAQGYTHITLDQWVSFLDFCYECEDLSTYDEANSAWPVLIDEYVEFMEQQQQK